MSPEAFQYCNLTLEKLGATVRLKPVGDSVELFNVNNLHSVDPKQINVWHSFDASFDPKQTKLQEEAKPFDTPNSPVRQQHRSSKPPGTFMRTNPARKGTFLRSNSKAKQHASKYNKAETSPPSSSNRGQMQSFFESRYSKNKHSSNASTTSKSYVKSETPMHSIVTRKSSRVLSNPSSPHPQNLWHENH